MTTDDRAKFEALTDERILMIGRRALDKCHGADAQQIYLAREVERVLASAQAASAEPVARKLILTPGKRERFDVAPDGSFIDDDDFTFDARLMVSGDFGDDVSRLAYAREIADLLNTTPAPAVAPADPIVYQEVPAAEPPREPTKIMLDAAEAWRANGFDWPAAMWRAMHDAYTATKPTAPAVRGECLGHGRPDWPDDLRTFQERAAYQRGVGDARRLVSELAAAEPAAVTDEQINKLLMQQDFWSLAGGDIGWSFGPQLRDFARAVLALATRAPEPQAAPQPDSRGQAREGWKLVRVEPIEAMEQFICTCDSRSGAGYTRDGEPVSPSWRTCYASLLAVASTPDEQRAQAAQEDVEAIVDRVCNDVAELPDRNSPEDWPEAMLVTHDELAEIVRTALAGRQQP